LKKRGFDLSDFAKRHPGGTIGRQIFLKASDIMHTGDEYPVVDEHISLKDAIYEMTSKGLGMTTVTESGGKFVGIITDGDLRRIFQKVKNPLDAPVSQFVIKNPKTIGKNKLASEALRVMEDSSITSLVVMDDDGHPLGVIHIHDILKAGITS